MYHSEIPKILCSENFGIFEIFLFRGFKHYTGIIIGSMFIFVKYGIDMVDEIEDKGSVNNKRLSLRKSCLVPVRTCPLIPYKGPCYGNGEYDELTETCKCDESIAYGEWCQFTEVSEKLKIVSL